MINGEVFLSCVAMLFILILNSFFLANSKNSGRFGWCFVGLFGIHSLIHADEQSLCDCLTLSTLSTFVVFGVRVLRQSGSPKQVDCWTPTLLQ